MALVLDQDDVNGDLFVLGTEGEAEELILTNRVYFDHASPQANDMNVGQRVAFTNVQGLEFIRINSYKLYHAAIPFNDALAIAYIRYLAAREGLISPSFTVANHHVQYNDCIQMTQAESAAFRNGLTAGNAGVYADEGAFNGLWGAAANVLNKAQIRKNFTDMVCCVAYIFRVRGHHYRTDFQQRYVTLWNRCLHNVNELPTSWQYIATCALHAIMPDVLDDFWIDAANNSRCAGTMIKRLDSMPAGSAGVGVLKRGLDDISMIFPDVADRVPDAKQEFERVWNQVKTSRWGPSINARFYGVNRILYNESSLGALASVVQGIYKNLAAESPLLDSPALARLANIAPATGGAIGQAALKTTRSDAFMLLPP